MMGENRPQSDHKGGGNNGGKPDSGQQRGHGELNKGKIPDFRHTPPPPPSDKGSDKK